MSFKTFDRTWARSEYWGLIVLKPSQLPAIASEKDYLTAVFGLEKSRQYQAAAEGYQTALTRWPRSLIAFMGLGNSLYALGDLSGAENAFRMAVLNHPEVQMPTTTSPRYFLSRGANGKHLKPRKKPLPSVGR